MILSLRPLKRSQLLPGDLFSNYVADYWRELNLDAYADVMLLVVANGPGYLDEQSNDVFLATLTPDNRKELHVIVHETEHEG